jgi:hypothetical protein
LEHSVWEGILRQQAHGLSTGMVQGGHCSSEWQLWVGGCSQACSLPQGLGQTGSAVPQGIGGNSLTCPQWQEISSNPAWRHGLQWPLWQGIVQWWMPHWSFLLQTSPQTWACLSLEQQAIPHSCLPQVLISLQTLRHLNSVTDATVSLEQVDVLVDPRHWQVKRI